MLFDGDCLEVGERGPVEAVTTRAGEGGGAQAERLDAEELADGLDVRVGHLDVLDEEVDDGSVAFEGCEACPEAGDEDREGVDEA